MGIFSWLLSAFGKSDKGLKDELDDVFRDDDEEFGFVTDFDKMQSHGGGKYTSRHGNDYERFRPINAIEKRGSYKIDQRFEVAGAFAQSIGVNAVCDFLADAGEDVEVTVKLEREPDNAFDVNAIRIFVSADGLKPVMIGYLPKEIAAECESELPIVEIETIYQRREISARTLVKRANAKK